MIISFILVTFLFYSGVKEKLDVSQSYSSEDYQLKDL